MVSAESIETSGLETASLKEGCRSRGVEYLVPEWVRVRKERFGLLFYDVRTTKLTFVRSGDDLVPPPFVGERRVLRVARPGQENGEAVARLLGKLAAKGLVVVSEAE